MSEDKNQLERLIFVAFVVILTVGMGVSGTVSAEVTGDLDKSGEALEGIDNANKNVASTTTIAGRIFFDDGTFNEVGGATVTLKDSSGNVIDTTTSASDGGYQFEVSQDGDYNVTANKQGFHKDYQNVCCVDVSEDDIQTVNVFLEPESAMVRFSVVSVNDPDIENADVSVYNVTNSSDVAELQTNSNGVTSNIDMITSDYRVTVEKPGYKTETKNFRIKGNDREIDITLIPIEGTIAGRVTDINANPLSGIDIFVDNISTSKTVKVTSNSQGDYSIDVKEGDYDLRVNDSCYTDFYKRVSVKAGRTETENIVLEAAGTIAGNVTDSNGNPMATEVEIRNASTGNVVEVVEAPNGRYSAKVKTGKYKVFANESGKTDTKTVTVTKCQTVTANLNLTLPTSTIAGIVTDTQNNPISGIDIYFNESFSYGSIADEVATSNSQGQYSVDVAPGNWTMEVNESCYTHFRKKISVAPGRTEAQNVVIEPTGKIKGNVTDSSGNPTQAEVEISNASTGKVVKTVNASGNYSTKVKTGTYDVFVNKSGKTDTKTVTVTKCQTVTADLQPTSSKQSVNKVIANMDSQDNKIQFRELQKAINYWAQDKEVPNTDGETIDFNRLQDLIRIWATDGTVGNN